MEKKIDLKVKPVNTSALNNKLKYDSGTPYRGQGA
jgi:hypothetical protein